MKTLNNLSVDRILTLAYGYLKGLPALAEEFFQETAAAVSPEDFRTKVLEFVPETVFTVA